MTSIIELFGTFDMSFQRQNSILIYGRSANESIPYRVFGPETLMTKMNDIHRYIPLCLKEVTTVLGPHPMKRQDILVVPSSFDSLGMARQGFNPFQFCTLINALELRVR